MSGLLLAFEFLHDALMDALQAERLNVVVLVHKFNAVSDVADHDLILFGFRREQAPQHLSLHHLLLLLLARVATL